MSDAELLCPFTGKPIEIVVMGCAGVDQAFMGRVSGPLSYSTSAFPTRDALVYHLRMRNGVSAEGVSPEPPRIEVREVTAPAPDAFEDQRGREEELDEAVKDHVEKAARTSGRRARRRIIVGPS